MDEQSFPQDSPQGVEQYSGEGPLPMVPAPAAELRGVVAAYVDDLWSYDTERRTLTLKRGVRRALLARRVGCWWHVQISGGVESKVAPGRLLDAVAAIVEGWR
jgi:hypothetical protein